MSDPLEAIPTMAPRAYSGAFGIPMPDPDELCEICRDGAYHRHGMIHARARGMRLTWVCDDCRAADA